MTNTSTNFPTERPFLTKTGWKILLSFCLILFLTFFFDNSLLRRGVGLRFSWLDGLMLYMTDFGMLFFAVALAAYLILQKRFRLLALLAMSLAFSFEISYLLKLIFQTPRPYFSLELATIPLTQASGYSFPSLHSAFAIGVIPFLSRIFKDKRKVFLSFLIAVFIAYSRAYLGVHYFSDILAGGLIGYLFSKGAIFIEEKYHFTDWFLGHIKSKLELRRQIAHLVIGLVLVFLLELKLLTANILALILLLGLIISFVYRYRPIPIIHELLLLFERPKDIETFPGRGPIFLVFGALLSLIFFPLDIAKGAITVLAVGDSISHLVGRYFGKTRVPFSKNKMLEGTVVAIAFSTLAALLFVDIYKAFLASLLTVSFEAIYPEKLARFLDDNIVIPLMAGVIMILM